MTVNNTNTTRDIRDEIEDETIPTPEEAHQKYLSSNASQIKQLKSICIKKILSEMDTVWKEIKVPVPDGTSIGVVDEVQRQFGKKDWQVTKSNDSKTLTFKKYQQSSRDPRD